MRHFPQAPKRCSFPVPVAGLIEGSLGGVGMLDRTRAVAGEPGNVTRADPGLGFPIPVADLTVRSLDSVEVLDSALEVTGGPERGQGATCSPAPEGRGCVPATDDSVQEVAGSASSRLAASPSLRS